MQINITFSSTNLGMKERWKANATGAEHVVGIVSSENRLEAFLDQLGAHLLQRLAGHVVVAHNRHLLGADVPDQQVLLQGQVLPDVVDPRVDLVAILAVRLAGEHVKHGLLDRVRKLLRAHPRSLRKAFVLSESIL